MTGNGNNHLVPVPTPPDTPPELDPEVRKSRYYARQSYTSGWHAIHRISEKLDLKKP